MTSLGKNVSILARNRVAFRRVLGVGQRRGFSTEGQPSTHAQSSPPSTSTSSPTPTPPTPSYTPAYSTPTYPSGRPRPYNPEARRRLEMYRRQAQQQLEQQALEEERRTFQLDKSKLYQKGHPGTMQGVIKEVINIGYIISLPTGREGLLPADHLGCSCDLELLSRLYAIGEELAVRVIEVPYPGGKDRCYVKAIGAMF